MQFILFSNTIGKRSNLDNMPFCKVQHMLQFLYTLMLKMYTVLYCKFYKYQINPALDKQK